MRVTVEGMETTEHRKGGENVKKKHFYFVKATRAFAVVADSQDEALEIVASIFQDNVLSVVTEETTEGLAHSLDGTRLYAEQRGEV